MPAKYIVIFVLIAALVAVIISAAATGGTDDYDYEEACPWCGQVHDGGPLDSLTEALHRILSFPDRLFNGGERRGGYGETALY